MKKFYPVILLTGIILLGACGPSEKERAVAPNSNVHESSQAQSSTTEESQSTAVSSTNEQTQQTVSSTNQQEATSSTQVSADSDSWSSIDEAIEFYEAVYKNPENEISKNILWDNYNRKCWSLIEQEGNTIVLHWSNIGGAGGSYDKFVKDGDTTQLIKYDGNASYPDSPTKTYTIRNSDNLVVE
ncbi:hypothetical protein BAU15_05980 [Enterococcus sp. JM4C]|uniref:hypothetical protein n=1 Tax=Candidatus Enterococcus huntleyi TaxID=1857217 RepID=UPI00137AADA2|nr:hypothetical protein [Enterococcus sp. JM4C]KAF1297099.1 hypothetical protein BAU15_05980 [Enterococcus sp. JM4C]